MGTKSTGTERPSKPSPWAEALSSAWGSGFGHGHPGTAHLDVTELVVLRAHLGDLQSREQRKWVSGSGWARHFSEVYLPLQSEQPYKKGIAFSIQTIPRSMGHF